MNVHKLDTFSGHRDCVYTLAHSGIPHKFFSAGGDGLVVSWDLSKPDLGELVAQVGASIYALAYDSTSKYLWIGHNFKGIQVVDPINKAQIASSKIASAAIFDIKLYGDKALLALGDGVIIVMDIPTFAVQKHIKASQKSIRSLAINPAGGEIAAGSSDWHITVFDSDGFTLKKRFLAHDNSVFTVQYSPDGRFLLSAGRDAHLKVWDAANNYEPVQDIPAHMFSINHLTYRPDGKYFATCSMDKSVKIWDADTFQLKKVIDRARHAGHGTSVNKLLWSEYEDLLVSCSDDRTISVWEIKE
ncbi:WD40 repeat domain-containing protein [Telluribacter humicola]|uniref:WD40 repeat domain-containing protein n=1 Tax=Telluribacter humicola TaxID=1720261 RepID=UPI001A968B2D|nr:WD40 repeat domain-containing protein [Telluribacter humicola]